MQSFYSRGKLLLTGEYVVLDGALSLAVPSKFGQHLTEQPITESKLIWNSINKDGKIWFENSFSLNKGKITADKKNEMSMRLANILNAAKTLNKDFLKSNIGFSVTTTLEFSRSWGLGTSSTLINNIALWANVDAYKLLEMTFGGSGYDIACAQNSSTLTYQLKGNDKQINLVDFNPEFKQELFFIHLNKKQDSREGISTYNLQKKEITNSISEISNITSKVLNCNSLKGFETLITEHEAIISDIIKVKPVKQSHFNDYNGAIKSLGAWGGDFILATGNLEEMNYFKKKGYKTILSFNDILL